MKKDKDSFTFTGPTIIRLLVFLVLFLLVNYYLLFAAVPPSANHSSGSTSFLSTQVASAAGKVLGTSQSEKLVTEFNNLLNGSKITQIVSQIRSQTSRYLQTELSKYRRELIDKIYQDLTK